MKAIILMHIGRVSLSQMTTNHSDIGGNSSLMIKNHMHREGCSTLIACHAHTRATNAIYFKTFHAKQCQGIHSFFNSKQA